jgi:hypothetical protein
MTLEKPPRGKSVKRKIMELEGKITAKITSQLISS